ncbi:hypothetical protein PGTUg99_030823 [Puccinia graminis f. sp. tritici]|uniref:Uncharacterized protein n=1 Tax=Puccinia graminis f. sp. tritici TaxID=56615 RepID=A0A5B0N3G4_PUCGR|nr:hypothetical protein PGTUg99_030823 [Puccinia graminis f. sp. tritici]
MSPQDPVIPFSPHLQAVPQPYHYLLPLAPHLSQLPPGPAGVPPVSREWPANTNSHTGPTHVSSQMPKMGCDHSTSLSPVRGPLSFNHQDPVRALPVIQDQEGYSRSPDPLPIPTPGMFQCDISFLIYCAWKNKQKKTTWVPVKSKENLSISFNCHTIDVAHFKVLVTNTCGARHPNMPPLMDHCTNVSQPTMLWVAHMGWNPAWLKTGSQCVASDPMFSAWMDAIIKGGVKKGSLYLKMANPSAEQSRVADNDLMASTVQRHEAQMATLRAALDKAPMASGSALDGPSQPLAIGQTPFDQDDDAEDSCDDGFDARRIIEEQIFQKYAGNTGVDPRHTVYPHPTDVNRYIILTSGNVTSWARVIHGKDKGTLSPEMVASIVNICTERMARKRPLSPDMATSAVGVAGPKGKLLEYLLFAGVANTEETMRVLKRNEVDSYTMFAEGGLITARQPPWRTPGADWRAGLHANLLQGSWPAVGVQACTPNFRS